MWNKSIVHWRTEDILNVSVAFTWHLPLARTLCQWNKQAGVEVHAGGPAVDLMPQYLAGVADEIGGEMYPLPLSRHNADATFTTRGCIRQCSFCAVPRIEGDFRELTEWIPAPIICDNNLLASSQKHFDTVIDRIKGFKGVDFNQGLDIRLLNDHHLERLQELRLPHLRFAWDNTNSENVVMDTIARIFKAGFPKGRISIYVLIGYKDTPEDALYRLTAVRGLGMNTNPMRYQPLDALSKDSYCGDNWTDPKGATNDITSLPRMMRYWSNRKVWKVPYSEFIG